MNGPPIILRATLRQIILLLWNAAWPLHPIPIRWSTELKLFEQDCEKWYKYILTAHSQLPEEDRRTYSGTPTNSKKRSRRKASSVDRPFICQVSIVCINLSHTAAYCMHLWSTDANMMFRSWIVEELTARKVRSSFIWHIRFICDNITCQCTSTHLRYIYSTLTSNTFPHT